MSNELLWDRQAIKRRKPLLLGEGKKATPTVADHSQIQRALAAPGQLVPHDVLLLQRMMGNQAVSRLLTASPRSAPPVQRASMVGPVQDRYEQEADRVARRVSTVSPRSHGSADAAVPAIGREGGAVDHKLARKIDHAKQGGSPVPPQIRRKVEQSLGADLGNVQVHTHRQAHEVNLELGAKAATHGSHIFLGKGQSPHDTSLMAHELTHVVQQTQSGGPTGGPIQRAVMSVEDWQKFSTVAKGSGKKDFARSGKLKAIDKALAQWHADSGDPQKKVQAAAKLKEKILAWQYSKTNKDGSITSRRNTEVRFLLNQIDSEISSMPAGDRIRANYGITLNNQAGVNAIKKDYKSEAREDVLSGLETRDWSDEELTGVEEALSSYKGMLGPSRRAKGFKSQPVTSFSRVKQGIDYDDSTSDYELDTTTFGETFTSSKNISMFDAGKNVKDFATDKSAPTPEELQKGWKGTIEHELSHALVEKQVIGKYVKEMAFWKSRYKAAYKSRTAAQTDGVEPPPSDYGASNANEDLAETMMFYFEDPTTLSTTYPLRYAFIRDNVAPLLK